jgi:HK97 family phage prohead protease
MNKSNFIIKNNISIRAETKENANWIEGIIPYNSKSVPMWGTTEVIDRTAFRKTLADKSNVKALFNHDDSKVLGTTDNGTLILENSDDGLLCRCELPNTSYAKDMFEIVKRGDIKTMSFGFVPVKFEDSENGKLRTLKEVKLDEVSFCVSYPAYPETNSKTYMRGFRKMKIDIETINEILEKEKLTEEDVTALQEVVTNLTKLIKENSPETENEAARAEPPKEDTQLNPDTSKEDEEEKEKEAVKQEILGLIDILFETEKETSNKEEPKEDKNE